MEKLPLEDLENVDVGTTEIALEDEQFAKIRPDYCYKLHGTVHWVFVYPNSRPPLKNIQREAIVSVLARPLTLSKEPHVLHIAEYPELSGKRAFRIDSYEFDYRKDDEAFKTHLSIFYRALAENGSIGDLF